MLYCYRKGVNPESRYYEMRYLKKSNEACLYDFNSEQFCNFDGEIISVAGELIFIRAGAESTKEIADAVIKHGGLPLLTREQIEMVENWPNYYLTKRKTIVVKGEQLLDNDFLERMKSEFNKKIFLKTKKKNYSGFFDMIYLTDKDSIIYRAIEACKDMDFIISDCVEMKKEEKNEEQRVEYRCFVFNGRIINISKHLFTTPHTIDQKIFDFALSVVDSLSPTSFPKSYVVDVAEYIDENGEIKIDVVEFNDIQGSGTMLYNSVVDRTGTNMLHENILDLPIEKRNANFQFSDSEIPTIPMVYYDEPGSFAAVLNSLYNTGMVLQYVNIKPPTDGINGEKLSIHPKGKLEEVKEIF